MMVLSRQLGLSLSSFLTKARKYICMMLELLLDWVRVTKELPSVSTPTIIEIRGHIRTVGTELVEPFARHFIRRMSLQPSHVSSIDRKLYPASHNSMNLRAHYYLSIRF